MEILLALALIFTIIKYKKIVYYFESEFDIPRWIAVFFLYTMWIMCIIFLIKYLL